MPSLYRPISVNLGGRGCYPSHLTHGILAEHCASETGTTAGHTNVREGHQVRLSVANPVLKAFNDANKNTWKINDIIRDWIVLKVIEDEGTGYLGIVYVNNITKNLVLAHRSTNFFLSLCTKNLFKQSGVHQDIEGVLMGKIVLHQLHGIQATGVAVRFAKSPLYKSYTLSFTGHSLGAWLASLSVLYCHDDFDFDLVQAVTFDGPGARPMMEKLRGNNIIGPGSPFKCEMHDFDIITYLSAPNIVNCANRHIGTVYTLLPLDINLGQTPDRNIRNAADVLKHAILRQIPGICLVNLGHLFQYMLPCFDPITGQPKSYKRVEKWPSIFYTDFPTSNKNSHISKMAMDYIKSLIPAGVLISDVGVKLIGGIAARVLNWHNTTADSVVHLALAFIQGNIDMNQFWLVHQFLHKSCGFFASAQSEIELFELRYAANYKLVDLNLSLARRTGSRIDRCISRLLKLKSEDMLERVQGQELLELLPKYQLNLLNKSFVVRQNYTGIVEIDDLRRVIRRLLRVSDFEQFLLNLNMPRLASNVADFKKEGNGNVSLTEDVTKTLSGDHKIVILKGMLKTGKTALIAEYAWRSRLDFTARFLRAGSELNLQNSSVKECLQLIQMLVDRGDGTIKSLVALLNETKQQVVFVLDDVKNSSDILSFIGEFIEIRNVRFIITTQHDNLFSNAKCDSLGGYYIFDHIVPEIQVEYGNDAGIEISNLLRNIIASTGYRAEQKVATHDIVKMLAVIKSQCVTDEDLVASLLPATYTSDDLNRAIANLRQHSILSIDFNHKIRTGWVVKHFALELYTSGLECIKYMSLMHLSNVSTARMFKKILSYNLRQEIGMSSNLVNCLKPEHKCNLVFVLTELLKDKSISDENMSVIQNLRTHTRRSCDEQLQLLITELGKQWGYSQANLQFKTAFLTNNGQPIQDMLRLFNIFWKRLAEGYKVDKSIVQAKHVIIAGPTGGGKSTVINELIGNELTCYPGRHGKETIITAQQNIGSNGVPIIGSNQAVSQTVEINPYFSDMNKDFVYWDIPGFGDTRGATYNMELAFMLRSLSEALPSLKVLLVVEASITSKGNNLRGLLTALCKLFDYDQIKESLSVIITKCDQFSSDTIVEDKLSYKDTFSKFYDAHQNDSYAWILKYLRDNTPTRAAFFPKVMSKGTISWDSFVDLTQALNSTECAKVVFNRSVDGLTNGIIYSLTSLLNDYAVHIIEQVVETKKLYIVKMIQLDTFRKTDLLTIKKFSISSTIAEKFLEELQDGAGYNSEVVTSLKNIFTIQYLNMLDPTIQPNLNSWVKPFVIFDALFESLIQAPVEDNTSDNGVLYTRAPILSAIELLQLYASTKTEIKEIRGASYLFIMDADLALPGVSLSIASVKWSIIGDRKVTLQGSMDAGRLDSGSFYGNGQKVIGGKISVDLDGVNGINGELGLSEVQKRAAQLQDQKEKLEAKIRFLNSLTQKGLSEEEANLKFEIENSQKNLGEIDAELLQLRDIGQNFMVDARSLDGGTIRRLELEKTELEDKVDKKVAKLKCISDLKVEIALYYQQLGKKNVYSVPRALTSEEEIRRFRSTTLQSLRAKISEIQTQANSRMDHEQSLEKYEYINSILKKSESIEMNINTIVNEWQLPNELNNESPGAQGVPCDPPSSNIKHLISINDTHVELTTAELDAGLHDFRSELNKQAKLIDILAKNCQKQEQEIETLIEEFNIAHESRKTCEHTRQILIDSLKSKRRALEEQLPSEFEKLKEIINNLTRAIGSKDKASKLVADLIAGRDITIPGSTETFVKTKRELLRVVDDSDFEKNRMGSKENIEQKMDCAFEDFIGQLQNMVDLRLHMKIESMEQVVNDLIDEYKLEDICPKYTSYENADSDLGRMRLEECRAQFRVLWEKSRWFFTSLRSRRLSLEELQSSTAVYCKKHENFMKRFEHFVEHNTQLLAAENEFRIASTQCEHARKEYASWKRTWVLLKIYTIWILQMNMINT